jgi:ubiquinone/menaquinone biosynthesis C-methylase UbiE
MNLDINLRKTFNSQAELYNKIRPTYPEVLFDTLIEKVKLQPDSKVLEIGPGTGQATIPMASKGYDITAVELGSDLANLASYNLRNYKNVKIITGAYEDIIIEPSTFDLIYAATAFHWIKPEFKYRKTYDILKKNGHLAIIGTNHVSDDSEDSFFFEAQPIYKKYKPGGKYDENFRLPSNSSLKIEDYDNKLFHLVSFQTFPQIIYYTAQEYSQLLDTYSNILALEVEKRIGFLTEIEELINKKFGGKIQKHFAMSLTILRKFTHSS